jgi:REP element-mobilizing transposase RayT
VIDRGNDRRNLFGGGGAAEAFERTLGEAARRFGWEVHASGVMRHHFHAAVEIAEPKLSAGMKWLQGTWIRRYKGFRRLVLLHQIRAVLDGCEEPESIGSAALCSPTGVMPP